MNTPQTPDELDEIRGRAVVTLLRQHRAFRHALDLYDDDDERELRQELGSTIREADEAHGVLSVPAEATEEMIDAALTENTTVCAAEINAALAASPLRRK